VKETGILFTPENIRAIREGRKTQTRRVITPQPTVNQFGTLLWTKGRADSQIVAGCPYGYWQPGDTGIHPKLYIKEGIVIDSRTGELKGYYIDGCRPTTRPYLKRLTAMFMAKRYARTWLEITDVRVQRLQDISEDDAKAEGVEQRSKSTWRNYFEDCYLSSAQQSFSSLWQLINGKNKPGEEWDAWDANPFVWAITFRRLP
jgi:hypothetical protein